MHVHVDTLVIKIIVMCHLYIMSHSEESDHSVKELQKQTGPGICWARDMLIISSCPSISEDVAVIISRAKLLPTAHVTM